MMMVMMIMVMMMVMMMMVMMMIFSQSQSRFWGAWALANLSLAWSGLAGASWILELNVPDALEARNRASGLPGLAWAGLA